jgi:predicted transcriptional regulator
MECGKKHKTLRRHIQTAHGLTPDQYRAEYGLPREYPMTAASYSEIRRNMAHSFGLGRKKGEAQLQRVPHPKVQPKATDDVKSQQPKASDLYSLLA